MEFYLLGIGFSMLAGIVDENPSMFRFITVLTFQTMSAIFLLKGMGVLQ